MEKKKLLLLSVLLVIVVGAAGAGYRILSGRVAPEDPLQLAADQRQEQEEAETDGQELLEAPDFTVYDGNGEAVSLSDFAGKPVIVNFWASWCGPCKLEMPYFDQAYEIYGEEIAFLMVNLTDGSQETQSSAEAFISAEGYGFPVYYDLDMDGAATYGVSSIPATLAVYADGFVAAGYVGTMNEAQVDLLMDLLLDSVNE